METAPFLSDIADGPPGAKAWWLSAKDGTRIRLGLWALEGREVKGTILLFPGRSEFIEKYGRTASEFASRGYATVAMDWRGQGMADRPAHRRDMGHVVSFDEYRQDVAAMRAALDELDLPKPYFLVGHSMGGAIGLRALHDGLDVKSVCFTSPMWGIKMTPFFSAISGVVLGLSRPLGLGKSFAPTTGPAAQMEFDDNPLTTDKAMFDYMSNQTATYPELALGGPSLTWVHAAVQETRTLMELHAPKMAALTFIGSLEKIVEADAIHDYMAKWPNGQLEMFDRAEHEVMMERPEIRNAVFNKIAAWFDTHRI